MWRVFTSAVKEIGLALQDPDEVDQNPPSDATEAAETSSKKLAGELEVTHGEAPPSQPVTLGDESYNSIKDPLSVHVPSPASPTQETETSLLAHPECDTVRHPMIEVPNGDASVSVQSGPSSHLTDMAAPVRKDSETMAWAQKRWASEKSMFLNRITALEDECQQLRTELTKAHLRLSELEQRAKEVAASAASAEALKEENRVLKISLGKLINQMYPDPAEPDV